MNTEDFIQSKIDKQEKVLCKLFASLAFAIAFYV